MIAYWLAALRPSMAAFISTALASTLIMNVSTACGCFFSATFSSVPLAMAYLVPFDYILMTTSGVFIALNTLPQYLSWIPFFNWLMYGNEIMSIAQWEGVTNISEINISSLISIFILNSHFSQQLAMLRTTHNFHAIRAVMKCCSTTVSPRIISILIL